MKKNESTKKLVLNAILLAIGLLLHQLTPALGLPMQPDFALAMLFIVIILNKGEYKVCLISGIIIGLFTALTTKFPGGQLPNIVDKLVTLHFAFLLMFFINKFKFFLKYNDKIRNIIAGAILFPLGTLVSGFTFLTAATFIVGLPASFESLFLVVVLPAILINLVVGMILLKAIERTTKALAIK
ncbi:MAG: tryptophan transporter [Sarcina sp.]